MNNTAQQPPETLMLLKPAEAAAHLRVNERSLRNWTKKGLIAATIIRGRYFYRRAVIERIAEEGLA